MAGENMWINPTGHSNPVFTSVSLFSYIHISTRQCRLTLPSIFRECLQNVPSSAAADFRTQQRGAMGWMAIFLLALSHAHTHASYAGARLASPPSQPAVALISRPRFSHILNRRLRNGAIGSSGGACAVSALDCFPKLLVGEE